MADIVLENSSSLAYKTFQNFPEIAFSAFSLTTPSMNPSYPPPWASTYLAQALHSSPYFANVSLSQTQTLPVRQGPALSRQSHLASVSPHSIHSSHTGLLAVPLTHKLFPNFPLLAPYMAGFSSFRFQPSPQKGPHWPSYLLSKFSIISLFGSFMVFITIKYLVIHMLAFFFLAFSSR